MDVLITYDVSTTDTAGERRLRRLANVCEKYGQRIQCSVFECRLSPSRLARLMTELEEVVDPKRDSLIIYRFPGMIENSKHCIGRNGKHQLGDPWLL